METPWPPPGRIALVRVHARSWVIHANHVVIAGAHMAESGQKMGMCNYCQELGPVYEQEDESKVIFLVCKRCIADVLKRIDIDRKIKKIRARKEWERYDNEGA